ncbi:TAF6-like RNA polymerase II p300/CBP-associated factor-associated factor 65 kDa subunit 6L isoform X2 [Monodelphis domestica]|uniref:TAF6-like RNA polymerase II p300/CBP-associated factor-associated factor 65 kDa subunit 6L isoform X2 n=1 Tax=Monodelphis domestica TaxID=13616 RepID=UPI0024E2680C|nr:TAF6-like RNA polymerase II p300/CBP-associated factor-associated factor 65 kDa subunit 6L isoform X2 [Monodelphis domestica]
MNGSRHVPSMHKAKYRFLGHSTVDPLPCWDRTIIDGSQNLFVPSAVSSLTDDLLKYYQQVTRAVLGDDPQLMKVALQDLQTNSKIAALLPYFVYVVSGVKSVSHDLEQLHRLLQVARSLLRNPHLCLGPYVRSLVGSVLYCVLEPLAASINPLNDHWTLRDGAALLLSHIFWTHGDLVNGLSQQILLSLQKVLADPVRPLCSHYGAVVGLHALGWKAVEQVLYPHLSTYWANLQAVLDDYSVSNAQVKADGHKVYGAILVAVERLLKMKAQAVEPSRRTRRPEDLPWTGLLLHESPPGGSGEPGFGPGAPLAPGTPGLGSPASPVSLGDTYRELYAFFGDSLATRFGTGQSAPTAARPPGAKKEPAAVADAVRKMPQLTANATVSPRDEESPRGANPGGPASAPAAAPESRPLPRVHRPRGAPRQQGLCAGARDVFQKSRFAPRGAPHFRFIIAGRQAGRRCRGRLFQTAFPPPQGPSPASRYAQKLPMIGRTARPARRWLLSDYSLYLPL